MDVFLELGKRSLPPSSDVLRGFFDATLDRGKPASALKGMCKTCQHRITLRQDRMCVHYLGCAGSNKCPDPPPETVQIVQQHHVLISYEVYTTNLKPPVVEDGASVAPAGGDGSGAFTGAKGYSGQPVPHLPGELSSRSELLVAELAVECFAPAPAGGIRCGPIINVLSANS